MSQSKENCNDFDSCESASRIKSLLEQYNKYISSNDITSVYALQSVIKQFVQNYSNNQLFNDFDHVEYQHNTKDDTNQFELFYNYLFTDAETMKCDIKSCKTVEIYYKSRYDRSSTDIKCLQNDDINNTHLIRLISRIHTYFIHSYDTERLTNEEFMSIKKQLSECKDYDSDEKQDKKTALISNIIKKKQKFVSNIIGSSKNNKFITSGSNKSLNQTEISKICTILNDNEISINSNKMTDIFENYGYHKQQLVDDLCDILYDNNQRKIVLCDILINELKIDSQIQRNQMYETILFQCVQKNELNQRNFAKMLRFKALQFYSSSECDEIKRIAKGANLNGKIFIKGVKEFMNALKFGKVFANMENYKKKKLTKIYVSINKWKVTESKSVEDKLKKDINETGKKFPEYKEQHTDYINKGTDMNIIQDFCTITNTSKNIAISFLKQSEWNVMFAVNKYYANETINKLDNITVDEKESEELIYNEGVEFWYWDSEKHGQNIMMSTRAREKNLKDELLAFSQFPLNQWKALTSECKIYIERNVIKAMSTNGTDTAIYGILKDAAISEKHLYAIKLYTDYSDMCSIFCEAFRLRKITDNEYERIQSVINRNEKVTNWAKLLIEAVQCYGELRTNKGVYYRGVNAEFMFPKFITRYNAPLSTTWSFNKAAEFAEGEGNGLVMKLEMYNEYIPGLDTTTMSIFREEKEILFFTKAVLRLSSIFQWYNKMWTGHSKYINGIQNMINIANGSIIWDRINYMKDIIGHLLDGFYVNSKLLPPYIASLLKYRLANVPKTIDFDFRELCRQFIWVQNIFVTNKNTPNICNASNLFRNCNHIRFRMLDIDTMDDECCQIIIDNASKIKRNSVTIEFQWNAATSIEKITNVERLFHHTKQGVAIILRTEINHHLPSNILHISKTVIRKQYEQKEKDKDFNDTQNTNQLSPIEKIIKKSIMEAIKSYGTVYKCKTFLFMNISENILELIYIFLPLELPDYISLTNSLRKDNIQIKQMDLAIAFAQHLYELKYLIDDLFDISAGERHEDILLCKVFDTFELSVEQKQIIYKSILYRYGTKNQLEHKHFVKIITNIASKLDRNIDCKQLEKFSVSQKLDGQIFIKNSKTFKTAVNFAKMFTSIDGYTKKKFSAIYRTMHKLTAK